MLSTVNILSYVFSSFDTFLARGLYMHSKGSLETDLSLDTYTSHFEVFRFVFN